MQPVTFNALVKKVTIKSLASLDKGVEIVLQGEDQRMIRLVDAPPDQMVQVTVQQQHLE